MGLLIGISFYNFDPNVLLYLLMLVVLLGCSGFLSGSETAFFSLSPADMEKVNTSKSKSNSTILSLLGLQDYLLATILIANNLTNICVVVLSNKIMDMTINFGDSHFVEFIAKVVIVTFLLLLFGEIIPKVFASGNALKVSQFASIPLEFLRKVFKPLSYILIGASSVISRSLTRNRHVNISMNELSNAIEITKAKSDEEKQILSGIVDFVNTEVSEIMRPRIDVIAIDISSNFDEVRRLIVESGYSRIPVYEETLDNIKGILYIKDLLRHVSEEEGFVWQAYLRKPFFVPENRKISDLLEDFQATKVHLAIVVDEYGSTLGLASLEDILEEIVGEIMDESDSEEHSSFVMVNDNTYIFDGKTHLNDFQRVLDLKDNVFDDIRGGAETVGGLMLEIKRDFVNEGETLTLGNISLTAQSIEGHRLVKVKVVISR